MAVKLELYRIFRTVAEEESISAAAHASTADIRQVLRQNAAIGSPPIFYPISQCRRSGLKPVR